MNRRFYSLLLLFCTACGLGTNEVSQKFYTPTTSSCQKQAVSDQFIVQWKDGTTTKEFAPSREHFLQNFLADHKDEIRFAEHDYIITVEPVSEIQPTALGDSPADWGEVDTEAQNLWNQNIYGKGVIVAVVDSGADTTHPQLTHQLYVNPNEPIDGIDNDDNGKVDDVSGWDFVHWTREITGDVLHGTHVSGIVLAEHGAGPMKGMAPKAQLLPLKFIDVNSGYLSDAILAIDYAVNIAKREDKPLVINASWGGTDCSVDLRTKMDEFNSRRVLFAVAAGNNGRDLSTYPIFPASFGLESEIVVAAHAYENVLATFSNYGRRVHLSAPGLDIYSTAPNGTFMRLHGTSMATPFVTGAAALLWGYKPTATTAQIRKAIFDAVEPGPFNVSLQGKLNVRKAKLALDNM